MTKRIVSAAAAILLCGVAACASGPKTDAQLQADKETAARVETALNADKALYARHITVRADNGVVRLSGYVWEAADLQLAMAIAEGVPGVSRVISDLELNRNGDQNSAVTR
ncbi:MAG TPA: BON domain-containing protein [Steroidobacteraceae bacterium]|nr:BON domain-containing protein [Steroidobacteraceae bacterium]